MSYPAFRTDPVATRRITWWACALGYLVTLGGVPLIAGGVYQCAIWLLKGSGVTDTGVGPALQYAEAVTELLMYSFLAAWIGAVLSVPVVVWAWAKGWFGWGTAMLTGIAMALVVMGGLQAESWIDVLRDLAVPSALLGLAFWLTVRITVPKAFNSK